MMKHGRSSRRSIMTLLIRRTQQLMQSSFRSPSRLSLTRSRKLDLFKCSSSHRGDVAHCLSSFSCKAPNTISPRTRDAEESTKICLTIHRSESIELLIKQRSFEGYILGIKK